MNDEATQNGARTKYSRWEYRDDKYEFRRWMAAKRPARMIDYFCDGRALHLKLDKSKPRREVKVFAEFKPVSSGTGYGKCDDLVRTRIIPAQIRQASIAQPLSLFRKFEGGWRAAVASWIRFLRREIRRRDKFIQSGRMGNGPAPRN